MTLPELTEVLKAGNHSLVVGRGESVSVRDGRGVRDLFELLSDEGAPLSGAFVADKVVGKGAAALMALGNVAGVHALVISRTALDLLARCGVEVTYGEVVPHIINRAGTGMCPVEELCGGCDTPQACLVKIKEFLKS